MQFLQEASRSDLFFIWYGETFAIAVYCIGIKAIHSLEQIQ